MKYWEFLIQKEGDQTWLPLETEQVEILEGRYRVVAHTDRANTPMEIQVSQLITDELPPRKRIRKRIGQTNEAGLVVVMPFVHLKPGQWALNCSSIQSADSSANSSADLPQDADWCYSVQLQVFAHTDEDWSAEWPVPDDSDSVVSEMVEGDRPPQTDSSAVHVNPDLPLIQAQAELETQRQNQGLTNTDLGDSAAAQALDYRVVLRQQAYLAHHSQPMSIMGKVTSLTETVQEETSQLWIRLQNPETAQVIMEAHRPLSLSRLPADFKVQIQLPAEVTTRVILGEVSLRTAAIDPNDKVEILASTAFTITAGIDQLLDAIANQDPGSFDEEISVLSGETASGRSNGYANSEPELAVPFLNPIQTTFVPAVGVVLPPQLDRPKPVDVNGFSQESTDRDNLTDQLELPNFGSPYSADTAANLIVSDGSSDRAAPHLASSRSPSRRTSRIGRLHIRCIIA